MTGLMVQEVREETNSGLTAWTEATGVTGITETRSAAWATSSFTVATGQWSTGSSGVTGSSVALEQLVYWSNRLA